MTVPTQNEINKKKRDNDKRLKRLQPNGAMTDKAIITVIRGAIRRAWMSCDTKLTLLAANCIPDMDDSTRTKWLYRCQHCQGLFKGSDIEVDHKNGENPCAKLEDVVNYARALLGVSWDDLQILCKPCHLNKTYVERFGVSESEASAMIEAAPVLKKNAAGVKAWLLKQGIQPESNPEKRKQQVLDFYRKEVNGKK